MKKLYIHKYMYTYLASPPYLTEYAPRTHLLSTDSDRLLLIDKFIILNFCFCSPNISECMHIVSSEAMCYGGAKSRWIIMFSFRS